MIITTRVISRRVTEMVYESDEVVEAMMGFAAHTIVMPVDEETVLNVEKFVTVPTDCPPYDDIYVVGTYQPDNIPVSMMVSPDDAVFIVSLKVERSPGEAPSPSQASLN